MATAPLVALTASTRHHDGAERVRVNQAYVRALEAAGMVPVVLPPLRDAHVAVGVLARFDGLVLSGGEDVDPAQYGAPPHPSLGALHPTRDVFELALTRAAKLRSLPILAICRGVQVLNVALGGTLVQDIPSEVTDAGNHDPDTPRDARVHDVLIEKGSRLAQALGETRIRANSFHHQSLAKVSPELKVTATAEDGIIEGVETIGDWWVVGVQWHPEELTGDDAPWDRRLFAAFGDRVRG